MMKMPTHICIPLMTTLIYARNPSQHTALVTQTNVPSKLGTCRLSLGLLQQYQFELNQPVLIECCEEIAEIESQSEPRVRFGYLCSIQVSSLQSNESTVQISPSIGLYFHEEESTNLDRVVLSITENHDGSCRKFPDYLKSSANGLIRATIYPLRFTSLLAKPVLNVCRHLIISADSREQISPTSINHLVSSLKSKIYNRYICAGCVVSINDEENNDIQINIQQSTPKYPALFVAETLITYEQNDKFLLPSSHPSQFHPISDVEGASSSISAMSHEFSSTAERALFEMVNLALRHPETFAALGLESPKGLLLYGPPGVGKTYTVRTVCAKLNVNLIAVDGSSLWSPYAGEAETRLRTLFEEARNVTRTPSLIFIDEIDVLCPARSRTASVASSQSSDRIVGQMLALLDGLNSRGSQFVVAATNHPNKIDPALRRPGRLDREVHIEVPTLAVRKQLLQKFTSRMNSDVSVDELATRAVGYVGADIEALSREAALNALQRGLRSNSSKIFNFNEKPDANAIRNPLGPSNVVLNYDWNRAFELVPASSRRGYLLSSAAQSGFEDVGGLDEIIVKLKQAVQWPMLHSVQMKKLNIRPTRGILLHGPAGNGKTSIVRALSSSVKAAFLMMDAAAVLSSYVGEAERIVRESFNRARANLPCILFIDEIDALVCKRSFSGGQSGSSGVEFRVLSTLLNEMDGINVADGLTVIAATNRLASLDEAILRPGRFDYVLEVPLPNEAARLSILQAKTRNTTLSSDVSLVDITKLTNGYSGAELSSIVRDACFMALRENLNAAEVTASHFNSAIDSQLRIR